EGLESTVEATPQASVLSLVTPVGLTAIIENGGVSLSWTYPDAIELDGFELHRNLRDGEKTIIMLPPDATGYFDNQITVGQTAIYHLSAIAANQKSPSASFEITIPHLQLDPAKMPRIVRQSYFIEGVAGANVQLFAEVEGSNPLHYTWYYNGRKMPGVTAQGIQIFNLSPEHVGTYFVEVSNPFGTTFSSPMKVEINPANLGGVDIEWNARFESNVGFESRSVGVYHEGNSGALVAGQFTPNGSKNSDLMLVSYDDAGNQLWSTRASFSKTSQEFVHKSIQDHQGNVIIGGTSRVNPAELVNDITPDLPRNPVDLPFLASIGRNGSINWTSTPSWNFDSRHFIVDMQSDGNGTIYLLGNMEHNNYKGMVIQPLSAVTGKSLDQILTNDATQFTAAAFKISKDKRIYVVGQSNEARDSASGLQIRCYGVNGKLDWKTDFGTIGINNFSPFSVHLSEKNSVYVVGSSYKSDPAGDIHVVCFDTQGKGKWQNTLGLPDGTEDIPVKAAVDHAGSIIIAGDTTSQMESTRIILGKFSNTGKADWSTLLPSSIPGMNDHITEMDIDRTGNIYLAAIRHAHGTGQDFASLRFNTDGLLIWEASFKQQGLVVEESTCIDADDQGNVILSGVAYLNTKQQVVSIRQTSTEAIENLLPKIKFNDKPFKNPVYAPGRWTIEVEAEDPDGEVTKVEFLDGAKVRGIDTEAPYTFEIASDMPTTARVFARAYDNLGGVAISEELTIVIAEKPDGGPSGTLPQQDSFLPEGSDLTLDFGITGAEPIRYQWFLNGERLRTANQPTLPILPNVTRANSGSYVLRAQNNEGKILSEPVVVSLDWQVVEGADNFEEATAIKGNTGFIRASNTEATMENGEPRHSKKKSGHSIWYRWRPDISGLTTLSLQGSSFDTLLGVYAGPSLTQLSEIESDDDRGGFSTSKLVFNAIAGVDYMIAIAGFNEANGNILFSWQLDPNQDISLPKISISPGKNTVNIGEPYQLQTSISGNLQGIILQWFRNGKAIPDANGTTFDIGSAKPEDAGVYWISINAGNVNARTKPAHLTVNIPRRGKIIRELVLEEKFADLFFFVQDFNPAPQFQPQAFASPFQAKAASLATGFTGAQIFNTFGATKEAGEPDHCGVPGGASQWFAYQSPTNGALSISTDGSDFDTVLAVYTSTGSSFDDLTEVSCDNDSGNDGQDSTVRFNATEGTIYYIAVDGVEAATGTVNLAYELEVGLTVQGVTIADLGMQFEITTVPNINFVIEGTEDFNNWVNLISTSSVDGNFVYIDNEALTGKQRFYRVYVTE
ncbi:Ig-like domain-containing protein, partial [Verrucomicrobia bacterium]|nr:Ig-like domain-containing protein [Verrucomicrobiota bacterium]